MYFTSCQSNFKNYKSSLDKAKIMFVQYQENKSAAKTDSFVVVDRYMFMKTPADRFGCTIYANGRDVKQNETD